MRTTTINGCVLACVAMAACGPAAVELPARGIGNATPFADAGTGSTHRVRSPITLDGRGSFDPDGQIVAYRWSVVMSPLPTPDVLADANAPVATFTSGEVGSYLLQLEVEDDGGATAVSLVPLVISPPVVNLHAGADGTTGWLGRAELAGTLTTEPGFTVTPEWRFLTRPAGSTALIADATTLTPSFVADVPGAYELALIGRTGFGPAVDREDTVTITATAHAQPLSTAQLVAVEYSRPLDLVIALFGFPTSLVLHDPATGTQRSVELPTNGFAPTSMAIEPAGRRVAIGTPVGLLIVDLETASIEQTFPVLQDELAFDSIGRVHSPPRFAGSDPLMTLDLTTGTVTTTTGFGESRGQNHVIRIHPGGTSMYVVDEGLAAIARYDISAAPVLQRQATYAGPPGLRPPLFITDDGTSLITGGGTVLHASATAALDMTVRGQLSTTVQSASHSSVTHEIATLSYLDAQQTYVGTRVTLSSDTSFVPRVSAPVPPYQGESVVPRFVAYSADGAALHLVVVNNRGTVLHTVTPP